MLIFRSLDLGNRIISKVFSNLNKGHDVIQLQFHNRNIFLFGNTVICYMIYILPGYNISHIKLPMVSIKISCFKYSAYRSWLQVLLFDLIILLFDSAEKGFYRPLVVILLYVSSRNSYWTALIIICFLSAFHFPPQEFSAFYFIRCCPVTFQLHQIHVFLKIIFGIKCTCIITAVSPCHHTRVWCSITFSSQRNMSCYVNGPQVSEASIGLSIF